MMALQNLNQLRCLTLQHFFTESVPAVVVSFEMDDEHMKQLTTHFTQLEHFYYSIESNLTINSIIAIAKNCPTLKKLEIIGTYDLPALANVEEVLFPHLKSLRLLSAIDEDWYVISCLNFLYLNDRISVFPPLTAILFSITLANPFMSRSLSAQDVAQLVRRHAPRMLLGGIEFVNANVFQDNVINLPLVF